MMGNKLIDGHFVGQSQVCVLQAFVVTQDTIVELDTETGKARRYKKDEEGKLERNGDDLILEDVTFPLNKLHVYLVKPE
jgi:hypothetical protein